MPERNNEYVYQPPEKFTEELRQRINNAGFSDEFKQQIKSAQTALTYREMLERLEWVDNDYCPICWQYKANGHAADCELAALLKESEVEHDALQQENIEAAEKALEVE